MSTAASGLLENMAESAEPLLYRIATYFMLTLLDDPAILALAFC